MPTKEYWIDRWRVEGPKATELSGATREEQSQIDRIRADFLFGPIPTDRPTVDFGCGFGKWANYFREYMGMDWNPRAREEAERRNPGKLFVAPIEIWTDNILIFTANVLQHNDFEGVKKILSFFQGRSVEFWAYEIEGVQLSHVFGRTPKDYRKIFEGFGFQPGAVFSHRVHGQVHNLMEFRKTL